MKLKLILLFLFIYSYCSAQIVDKRGCVELTDGTVCCGLISYYEIQQKNLHVKDSKGEVNIIQPAQVKTVLLDDGEKFVSYPLATETTTCYLILRSLIESGKISLFKKPKSGPPSYYVLKEGKLYYLQKDQITVSPDSAENFPFDYKYKRTLRHLMSDQPGFDTKINTIHLNETELERLITFYNTGNSSYSGKFKNRPNWSAFGQISGYRYGHFDAKPDAAKSATAGIQYNFSKWKSSAIKLSFDYRYFHHTYKDLTSYNLAIRYSYALLDEEHYSFYLMANIADFSYFLYTDPDIDNINHNHIAFRAHFHPGIGLEITPKQRSSFFVEYNGLSNLGEYSLNFSLGFRFKFRK